MGCVDNISYDKFPQQSKRVNCRVRVCFHYDTKKWINGVIVRDDIESPGETLIMLRNGMIVIGKECQYMLEIGG